VGVEGVELSAGQNAIEGVAEERVKLVTLDSVIGVAVFGVIWHHITCL
jgi:hypothetical protein